MKFCSFLVLLDMQAKLLQYDQIQQYRTGSIINPYVP